LLALQSLFILDSSPAPTTSKKRSLKVKVKTLNLRVDQLEA
ncbi:30057_t:CDS:1, partial [Racocetra persica]